MRLRDIEFGSVFNASGGRNFFGTDSWWFHRPLSLVGLSYAGSTFVSKTTTIGEKPGFMPLHTATTTPKELVPGCIRVYPAKNVVLNKVGLSGPGLEWLLDQGDWQSRREPFVISIMAIKKTPAERLEEIRAMTEMIAAEREDFRAPFALQVNFSCPNVGHDQSEMVGEVGDVLDLVGKILPGVPVIAKFNAELEIAKAVEIGRHANLDAIVMGNTIKFGHLPDKIDWKGLFGTDVSPLAGYGGDPDGGGLSGAPLLPIIVEWIKAARAAGFAKPIIACGGILHVQDVRWLADIGASAVEIGSASILRPWRVQSIINEGRRLFA